MLTNINRKMRSKVIFSFLLIESLVTFNCFGQIRSITGDQLSYAEGKTLNLYKYSTPYDRTLVANLKVTQGSISYSSNISEVDTYMIENPEEKRFIIFVWDSDLLIKFDSAQFHKSKVIGSLLTAELDSSESLLYKQADKNRDRFLIVCDSIEGHDLKMDIQLEKQMVDQQANHRIMHQNRF